MAQSLVTASTNPVAMSDKEKVYRMSLIKAVVKAIISLSSLDDLRDFLDMYSKPGLSVGERSALAKNYAAPVRDALIGELRQLVCLCYSDYSISLDGTPSFAEAECVILRMVTKDLKIVEVVARVALFQKKINSDALANHLLKTIQIRLGLPLDTWRSVQLDRASTNKSAIKKITSEFGTAKPSMSFSCSHGMNNAGKKFIDSAPNFESLRKLYQGLVQYPGKAREYAANVFGTSVVTCSGVRFMQKIEQATQMHSKGIKDVILKNVLPYCLTNKYSEASARSLHLQFRLETKKANVAMDILEAAVLGDVGIPFCIACYQLEGDAPLILSSY